MKYLLLISFVFVACRKTVVQENVKPMEIEGIRFKEGYIEYNSDDFVFDGCCCTSVRRIPIDSNGTIILTKIKI